MPKWILLKKFCELTGLNKSKIVGMMRSGEFERGKDYVKAPDGRIHIYSAIANIYGANNSPDYCNLSEAEIIKMADCLTPRVGVYFLVRENRIVYVGKSTNIHARLNTHSNDKSKEFDSVVIVDLDESDIDVVERGYIRKFKPEYNTIFSVKDNENTHR